MKTFPVFRLAAFTATLFAAMTALCSQPAFAGRLGHGMPIGPDAAPKGYDHLLCYVTEPANAFPAVYVDLFDQFYPNGFTTELSQVGAACTPAKKVLMGRKPIKGFKPNGHYVCYSMSPNPTADVTTAYINQLEKNSMYWEYAYFLCVPTYKYASGGDDASPDMGAPKGYTHLMLYDSSKGGVTFTNALPATSVVVYDQFFPDGFSATLGNPWFLLTPTKKVLEGRKPVKGPKPNGHWVFYLFNAPPAVQDPRDYVNQLERNSLVAYFPNYLMVPTYKYPPSGGQTRPPLRRVRAPLPGQKPQ